MAKNEAFKWLVQAVRIAIAGSTVSEPIGELLVGVGRENSLARIDIVLKEFGHQERMPVGWVSQCGLK